MRRNSRGLDPYADKEYLIALAQSRVSSALDARRTHLFPYGVITAGRSAFHDKATAEEASEDVRFFPERDIDRLRPRKRTFFAASEMTLNFIFPTRFPTELVGPLSAGKADMARTCRNVRNDPEQTSPEQIVSMCHGQLAGRSKIWQ